MNHLLQSQLQSYASSGLYPLHMPGHKRRVVPAPGLPAGWDMTEVPGVDDLHDADGILADAMARTAALWGAKRTWYLVNGSTCGILAAIRAAVVSSGRTAVICARNCHKSVYHAIELNRLTAHWLVPPVDPAFGIYGSITPAMVADALRACPDTAAVILTSPTYEGVLSDLAAIAALCHAANVPLIVDEAHGAHYLPLAAAHGWQGGAIAAGADVITLGNHTFGKVQVANFLEENPYMLRPANFTGRAPGRGWAVYDCGRVQVGVLNLIGRCNLDFNAENPFTTADRILKNADKPTFVLVDFHAQATSEKLAMRYYLDGRVSALWGTHTHVPTADAGVCEKGTGYITDLGMTGPARSVLGIRPEQSVEFFLGGLPGRYQTAEGPCRLQGALFTLDSSTGLCVGVERIEVS